MGDVNEQTAIVIEIAANVPVSGMHLCATEAFPPRWCTQFNINERQAAG